MSSYESQPRNRCAAWSLALGIFSVLTSWVFVIVVIPAIAGLITGIIGVRRGRRQQAAEPEATYVVPLQPVVRRSIRRAWWGIWLSAAAILLDVVFVVLLVSTTSPSGVYIGG